MNEGTIAYLGKGFGFLKVKGRKSDLFFHAKELLDDIQFSDLKIDDLLHFDEITASGKGDQAVGVSFA